VLSYETKTVNTYFWEKKSLRNNINNCETLKAELACNQSWICYGLNDVIVFLVNTCRDKLACKFSKNITEVFK
jgi:hypothetical protein